MKSRQAARLMARCVQCGFAKVSKLFEQFTLSINEVSQDCCFENGTASSRFVA